MPEYRVPCGVSFTESCLSCAKQEKGPFCRLPQPIVAALNSVRQSSLYPRGAVLFSEGEAPRGVFILCSGQAKLSIGSSTGHAINVRIVGPGESLGLGSIVANEPYGMRAETLSHCQVSFIPRLQFLQLLRAHPDLSLNVSRHLAMELHKAYDQTRLLALSPGTQVKVAHFLLAWADQQENLAEEGTRLAVHATHEEIGESIGAARETVSRILGDFKRRQLIRVRGGTIVILQPQQLRGLTSYR